MYKDKSFSKLDRVYSKHLYSGFVGTFMHYCHRKLECYDFDDNLPKILEIGPGTVPHAPYIKHAYEEYHIIETSDYAIDELKKQGYTNIKNYDGSTLPYIDGYFDRIIMSHVLEHISNPHSFLLHLMKKLKEGGILSISLPTDPGLLWRSSRQIIKIFSLNRGQDVSNLEYDYINSIEHINSIFNLRNIIKYHFTGKFHETFLPFKVSLPDLNLFYNVHIKKDNPRSE